MRARGQDTTPKATEGDPRDDLKGETRVSSMRTKEHGKAWSVPGWNDFVQLETEEITHLQRPRKCETTALWIWDLRGGGLVWVRHYPNSLFTHCPPGPSSLWTHRAASRSHVCPRQGGLYVIYAPTFKRELFISTCSRAPQARDSGHLY